MTFESVADSSNGVQRAETSTTEAENDTLIGNIDGGVYDEDGNILNQMLSFSPSLPPSHYSVFFSCIVCVS